MKKFKDKQAGLLTYSDLKTVKGQVSYWLLTLFLVVVTVTCIVPTIWTVLTSFKDTREIYQEFGFFPKDMSWSSIVTRITQSWADMNLGRSMINTVIMSIGCLVFEVVIDGIGGYVLSRIKPRGSQLVLILILWTLMMPAQIRTVPNYISYMSFPFASGDRGINLLDTYWPMWLVSGANAYAVLLFKNAFDGISMSLIEAARIDGCAEMKIFYRIMIPLSMPIIIYITITSLSTAWSNFFTPYLVLQSEKKLIMPVKLYLAKNDSTIQMNSYMMGLVFASIPSFIIYALFQRHIQGGINVGGVKG